MKKRYGFLHFLRIFWINVIITLKAAYEYKINFYNYVILEVMHTITPFFIGVVIIDKFGNSIGWTFIDYVIFTYLLRLQIIVMGTFAWGNSIWKSIISGEFNKYLIRPGNVFFNYSLSIKFNTVVSLLVVNILYLPVVIYYTKINILTWFLCAILILPLGILHASIRILFESIAFFSIKLPKLFILSYSELERSLKVYPGNFFDKFFIKSLLFIVPLYFTGTLLVPLFQGKFAPNFTYQIYTILMLFFVSTTGIFLLWHYGLKRYEAFG